MKKIKSIGGVCFSLAAVAALAFTGCSSEAGTEIFSIETLKITGAPQSVNLSEKSVRLGIEYAPEKNVEPFAVRWHCDGQSVATIDEQGVLSLFSAGKVIVSASVIGKREIADRVAIEIVSKEEKISGVSITGRPENDTVTYPCEAFTLSYSTEPEEKEFAAEWYSASSKTATIDENGKVRVHGKGATEIGVRSKTDNKVKDSFVLYVGGAENVRQISIAGKPTDGAMRAGTSVLLSCKYEPGDCAWFKETWQSSDLSVAAVDENGKLTAVGEGETTITLTAEGKNLSDSFLLTVSKGLDALCEDFEYAFISGGSGYGNYRSIAKNYDGVRVSITEEQSEIPRGGYGKALKVSADSNAYAGVILLPREGVKAGTTYRFLAKIKVISVSCESAYVFCNLKADGKTYVFGGGEQSGNPVPAGESIVLGGEFTALRDGAISLEIFIHNGGETIAATFTIDDVNLIAEEAGSDEIS